MIVIKLWGGLGNQMFQYAFGYSLAKSTNQELKFDCSFYANQPTYTGKRDVEIASLAISDIDKFVPNKRIRFLSNRYCGAILRHFPPFFIPAGAGMMYIKEPLHKYINNLHHEKSVYYDGYWQTSKYFKDYRNDLLKLFLPKDGFSKVELDLFSMLQKENSVAVHIRKGDFTNSSVRKVGHLLPISYYKNSMDFFRKKIEKTSFFIVSDDPEWARLQFGGLSDVKFIADYNNGSMLTDLFCIANCKHGIMSASTFSWWGNWLRRDAGLVVVPSGLYYNEFFYEPEWIKIDLNGVNE
ncbi:MAG: alpha-1,2-fucosyltransferase [Ruminococcaceae bacterium]|nr:alpha-1,2-fucosyltransferase [Oscillospiraceae bacterium]